ncbi:MAG TPA: N-acetylmuramoyl-L-alanine amidase [Acidimicrobiales bacterium]|nr:N-acetylmuramoyl-L-alanine amidase [Acidimicrobiales bacterium]
MPSRRGSPLAAWVGDGIPNFTPGRAGHDMWSEPRFIVLHTMVGTEAAARTRFSNPNEGASSTYGVTLDGRIFQYVSELDAAWANGTMYNQPGANLDSISIEHEDDGDYNGPRTPELYAASTRLVADIAAFYGIPLDRDHVNPPSHELGHRECATAPTACPDSLDVSGIVAAALAGGGGGFLADLTAAQQQQLLADAHGAATYGMFGFYADPVTNKPVGAPSYLADQFASIQGQLALLVKGQGVEQAAVAALQGNLAAASAVAALATALQAVKAELDTVAAAQAGGKPADFTALQNAIATAMAHVDVVGHHLGVDAATGVDT